MSSTDKALPAAARTETDRSLKVERDRTDEAFRRRNAEVDGDADQVIQEEREAADDGDRTSDELQIERTRADDLIEMSRNDRARALRELLRLEREATDEHLLIERARSDEAILTRDDFLGMVSHDLRNLLGGIALTAETIAHRAGGDTSDPSLVRSASTIQRLTARMNRLIGDLVDVVAIDAGSLKVAPTVGDAASLVREAAETFQLAAAAKQQTLEVAVASEPLLARFDHERILQVLANLLSNATKFTRPGGRIVLRAEPVERQVQITVADEGIGIEPSKLEAVFERFWQQAPEERRGLGLGLYISRQIVEAHRSTLWVTSTPGQGSTFGFALPLA